MALNINKQHSKSNLLPNEVPAPGTETLFPVEGRTIQENPCRDHKLKQSEDNNVILIDRDTANTPNSSLRNHDSDKKKTRLNFCISKINSKTWLRVEAGLLITVVVMVWTLLTLPIVFFYLPVDMENVVNNVTNGTVSEHCTTSMMYEGTTCKSELQSLGSCIPSSSQSSSILVESDQSETVRPLLNALNTFASDECRIAALSFLCVHFFGLCDSTGRAYRPSSSQCIEISTGVCAREWTLASSFPDVTLPDCTSFPDETILMKSCESNSNTNENSSEIPTEVFDVQSLTSTQGNIQQQNCTKTCSEQFHCKVENSEEVCVPTCGRFKEYSDEATLTIDVLVLLCVFIGVFSSSAVLVISVVRRKEMFVFPTLIVVYETLTFLFLAITVLIAYTNRTALFCNSTEVLETINNPTAFCTITGIVFYYTLCQLAMWWILHVMVVFWKLKFPFHAHSFDKTKYLHIICVILALLLPLAPIIATIIESRVDSKENDIDTTSIGFGVTRFPPISCTGTNINVVFYSLILPLDLVLFIGFPLLVFIFWIMHKNYIYKHKKGSKMGTAEKKILIVFCYYVIFSVFSLSSFTIATRNIELYFNTITSYFLCERSGYDPYNPCDQSSLEEYSQPEISAISFILFGMFPVANLIFVVNYRKARKLLQSCLNKLYCCTKQTEEQHSKPTQSTTNGGEYKEQSF